MCDRQAEELERENEELRTVLEAARDAMRTITAGVAHFTGYDSTCDR